MRKKPKVNPKKLDEIIEHAGKHLSDAAKQALRNGNEGQATEDPRPRGHGNAEPPRPNIGEL